MMSTDKKQIIELFSDPAQACDAFMKLAFAAMDTVKLLDDELKLTCNALADLDFEHNLLLDEKAELQEKYAGYDQTLDLLRSSNEDLKSEIDDLKKESDALTAERDAYAARIAELNSALDALTAERDAYAFAFPNFAQSLQPSQIGAKQ